MFGAAEALIRTVERVLRKIEKKIDYVIDSDYLKQTTNILGYTVSNTEIVAEVIHNNGVIILRNSEEKISWLNMQGLVRNYNYVLIEDLLYPEESWAWYRRFAHAPWLGDAEFLDVHNKMRAHSLLDMPCCYELADLVKQTNSLPGNILEVGVWRGGSGFLLAHYAKKAKKRVYLADTFEGVVNTDEEKDNFYVDGVHADTSPAIVRALFDNYGESNYEILQGIFPDDTGATISEETICFCHIDVDVYWSTRLITEWVWPRMPAGGIIAYDDYGFWGCNGVTNYINEIAHGKDRRFFYNLNGHGILVKL